MTPNPCSQYRHISTRSGTTTQSVSRNPGWKLVICQRREFGDEIDIIGCDAASVLGGCAASLRACDWSRRGGPLIRSWGGLTSHVDPRYGGGRKSRFGDGLNLRERMASVRDCDDEACPDGF